MNHKIQEIIERATDNDVLVTCDGRGKAAKRAELRRLILRTVLEVVRESGVEGALEASWRSLASVVIASQIKLGASPANAESIADKHPAVVEARAALRTLKELQGEAR